MTALAGVCSFGKPIEVAAAARSMLAAQRQYGPQVPAIHALSRAAFGRGLYPVLPEDEFDRQPMIDPTGRLMLVADARIDNRAELLDTFGCTRDAPFSDAELVFRAYLKWGEETPSRILGDFAFAVWDDHDQSVLLARDIAGQRPLHYHVGDGFVAFASMPQGVHAAGIPRQVDRKYLAAFVADLPNPSSSTSFENVMRVEPGQLVRIARGGVTRRKYWQMPTREIRYAKESDYVEAFREQLDRATAARLRGAESLVGAHLSAGLDSSAVAATAARLLSPGGGSVVAFTSAPREGFSGAGFPGRISDESGPASEVVAQYPNMRHLVVRPASTSALDILGRDAELFQEPVGHPCNFVWWSAVHDEARARGISVILTGEAGNLTMSAGGLGMLTEFVRTGRLLSWFREARALARTAATWKGVLATSFGPWTPRPIWRLLVERYATSGAGELPPLIHPELRDQLEAERHSRGRDTRPERSHRKLLWSLLQQHEPGNFRKGILAGWGIDERDPTADRRLADFCFALPAEQFLSGGMMRRLARLSLADRLPDSILSGIRGYQYADWYERLDGESLESAVNDLESGPVASSMLDFGELRELVTDWPSSDWNSPTNIAKYRLRFLMALSAGAFANKVCQ